MCTYRYIHTQGVIIFTTGNIRLKCVYIYNIFDEFVWYLLSWNLLES